MGRSSERNLACRSRKSHREKGLGSIAVFLDKHALFWTNSATSGAAIRALMSIRPIGLVHLRQRFVRGSQWRATVLGSRTEPERLLPDMLGIRLSETFL